MYTHMHTQINIVLEQCRVVDLTHIIICNLWHQSRSDTLEGWQQAYISSTHLITKRITHTHATARFRCFWNVRLATRKSGSRTNCAPLLNIPVNITDDEMRRMWWKMHSEDPHLWSTGSNTRLKYVLISKCSQHYWGSLLLLSFDAKNIPCILTEISSVHSLLIPEYFLIFLSWIGIYICN